MPRARIVSLCFQVLAAFWAVIVIARAQIMPRWHAYAIATVGIVVISAVGTRLKHRLIKRSKGNSSEVAATGPRR
jgi:Na+/glutamate symporter